MCSSRIKVIDGSRKNEITLVKGDLRGSVRTRHLCIATMQNIRENLFFAFIYNAIGVPQTTGALFHTFDLLLKPTLQRQL